VGLVKVHTRLSTSKRISLPQGSLRICSLAKKHVGNLMCGTLAVLSLAQLPDSVPVRGQRIGVTYSSDAQTVAALKRLSPAAQTVMDQLSH
jgi:hypothetical protein